MICPRGLDNFIQVLDPGPRRHVNHGRPSWPARAGRARLARLLFGRKTLLCFFLLVFAGGCSSPTPPTTAPTPKEEPVSTPAPNNPSDPAIIARCDGFAVDLEDFDKAIKRMALFGPTAEWTPIPKNVRSSPQFQHSTTVSLLELMILRRAAKSEAIAITPEAIEAQITKEPSLRRLAPLSASERTEQLARAELTLSDLNTVVADRIIARELPRKLIPDTQDPETLWAAYKKLEERAVVSFVAVPNTPASKTIDAFVANHIDQIERYHRDNAKLFTKPTSRRTKIIELKPKTDKPEEAAELREVLGQLRTQALAGTDFSMLAKSKSQHYSASRGGDLGFVVRRQRPEAFSVPVGSITEPAEGPKGTWFILYVEEEVPSHLKPLTGSIKREVAARLLRGRSPNAKPLQIVAEIQKIWRSDLAKVAKGVATTDLDDFLKREHLRREKTLKFIAEAGSEAFIPGIGTSPKVMTAVAGLTLENPMVAEPLFHRGNLYVLVLSEKKKATRTQFAADQEAFTKQYLKSRRKASVRELLEAVKAKGIELNLKPVQERYGLITKKP